MFTLLIDYCDTDNIIWLLRYYYAWSNLETVLQYFTRIPRYIELGEIKPSQSNYYMGADVTLCSNEVEHWKKLVKHKNIML